MRILSPGPSVALYGPGAIWRDDVKWPIASLFTCDSSYVVQRFDKTIIDITRRAVPLRQPSHVFKSRAKCSNILPLEMSNFRACTSLRAVAPTVVLAFKPITAGLADFRTVCYPLSSYSPESRFVAPIDLMEIRLFQRTNLTHSCQSTPCTISHLLGAISHL